MIALGDGAQDSGDASTINQANAAGASGSDSLTLKSTPPAYIICQSTEENLLNQTDYEGVFLRTSYLQGSYVMSRPTGYTNLAVSAAFLASDSSATASSNKQNRPNVNVNLQNNAAAPASTEQ